MKTAIACEVQDHFEHACVLRLPVKLQLTNGDMAAGTAWDINKVDGVESLVLKQPDATIALTSIRELRYPHELGDELEDGTRWRVINN